MREFKSLNLKSQNLSRRYFYLRNQKKSHIKMSAALQHKKKVLALMPGGSRKIHEIPG